MKKIKWKRDVWLSIESIAHWFPYFSAKKTLIIIAFHITHQFKKDFNHYELYVCTTKKIHTLTNFVDIFNCIAHTHTHTDSINFLEIKPNGTHIVLVFFSFFFCNKRKMTISLFYVDDGFVILVFKIFARKTMAKYGKNTIIKMKPVIKKCLSLKCDCWSQYVAIYLFGRLSLSGCYFMRYSIQFSLNFPIDAPYN